MACLFSLLYNTPLQGVTKTPWLEADVIPTFWVLTQLLGLGRSCDSHTKEQNSPLRQRSRCTETWDAWLGHFLSHSTFWRNKTVLKENSELSSIIFLLQPAKCQSLFCLTLTAFVNCSGWYLLIHGEFSHLPLLMNQMVSSWQLTREIVPFPCCIINQESFLLLSSADTFLHTLNYLRWTDCSEVSTLKPSEWNA